MFARDGYVLPEMLMFCRRRRYSDADADVLPQTRMSAGDCDVRPGDSETLPETLLPGKTDVLPEMVMSAGCDEDGRM
jgi:hypothetical protein